MFVCFPINETSVHPKTGLSECFSNTDLISSGICVPDNWILQLQGLLPVSDYVQKLEGTEHLTLSASSLCNWLVCLQGFSSLAADLV